MEEEKTIRKPPVVFTILLFIFMILVILNLISLPKYLHIYIDDGVGLNTSTITKAYGILELLASIFAFMSIYRALQRKPYSIVMLKFSSFYILFKFIGRLAEGIKGFNPMLKPYLYLQGVLVLFCILFCIYLFKSKELKAYIPSKERRFGIQGWLAIGLLSLFIGFWGFYEGNTIIRINNSMRIEPKDVQLSQAEFTDGFVAFKPMAGWNKISKEEDIFVFNIEGDSSVQIVVASPGPELCRYRTDYYTILSQAFKVQVPDSIPIKEVAFNDELEINGHKFYSNTYELGINRPNKLYWTFSALIDRNSYKIVTLSNFELNSYERSISMAKEFMNTVRFDLKKRPVMNK